MVDLRYLDILPHELGHAVDFWFGSLNALTRTVILYDDKALFDIFTEEFEAKHQEIYEMVMEEYKNIINSNINDKAYDILIDNMDLYRLLSLVKPDLRDKEKTKFRREAQKELYKNGFVETYYQLIKRDCYSILNDKYSPILDALSSKYDFNGLYLAHHDQEYYRSSRFCTTEEFFANMFAAKVTSKHVYYDNLIKYLPKSFDAFERLFSIFYDRIQNNKKFVDLKIIRGGHKNVIKHINQSRSAQL